MKLPLSWLREYAPVEVSTEPAEVARRLTAAGLEVESVEPAGHDISGVVVAKVLAIEELAEFKKPIRYCRVTTRDDTGEDDIRADAGAEGAAREDAGHGNAEDAERDDAGPEGTDGEGAAGDGTFGVICGATNFAVGDRVALAKPGAVLPGGFQIGARKTYGRLSEGMICAADELGIGTDHSGILVLPADAPLGADFVRYAGLRDEVLDIAVTPDRGDCVSVRGVARELGIAFGVPFTDPADAGLPGARRARRRPRLGVR